MILKNSPLNKMHIYILPMVDRWNLDEDDEDYPGNLKMNENPFLRFIDLKTFLKYYSNPDVENVKKDLIEAFSNSKYFDWKLRGYDEIYVFKVKIPFSTDYDLDWAEFFIYGYKLDNNGTCYLASRVDLKHLIFHINGGFKVDWEDGCQDDFSNFLEKTIKSTRLVDEIFNFLIGF